MGKIPQNSELTFLSNHSSNPTEKTRETLVREELDLFKEATIKAAFHKSVLEERQSWKRHDTWRQCDWILKTKHVEDRAHGVKYSMVWWNHNRTVQLWYKALCLAEPTPPLLWSVVAASWSEETTKWTEKGKFLRTACFRVLETFLCSKCV